MIEIMVKYWEMGYDEVFVDPISQVITPAYADWALEWVLDQLDWFETIDSALVK